MELVFEYSKQIASGQNPIITHLADNTVIAIYQNGNQLVCRYGDFVESNPNATVFGSPIVIANDATPETIENIRFSGGQNWLTWKSGTRQRAALLPESPYIMKPLFYKGFVLGVHSKEMEEACEEDTTPIDITPEMIEQFGVDHWNGFVAGRLAYKQMYPQGG